MGERGGGEVAFGRRLILIAIGLFFDWRYLLVVGFAGTQGDIVPLECHYIHVIPKINRERVDRKSVV